MLSDVLRYNITFMEIVSRMSKIFLSNPLMPGLRNGLLAVFVNAAVLGSAALSEEKRQLDSHEHGLGELNIAVDGSTVAIELHAPGADIVGFEYVAKSFDDRLTVKKALKSLSHPLELFLLPDPAECRVTEAEAHLETEGVHDDHADHDDHAEGPVHSEFHATYTLVCNNLSALTEITFAYFDAFENALELEVQLLTASGAQAFEVKRTNPTLDLRGMF